MSSLLGHRHGEKTHFSRTEKRTINSFTCPLVSLSIRPFVNLSTCWLVNSPPVVIFSVRNLTLWVPFFSPIVHLAAKNRFSRGFVLMQNEVSLRIRQNEYLFERAAICTNFWAIYSKI